MDDISASAEQEIAIIGLTVRFPAAENSEVFWQNIRQGKEAITCFTDEEMIAAGVDPVLLRHPRYVKAGKPLPGIEFFDADFFGFTPREAEIMDPQHRLFLECAWEALEHAGYSTEHETKRVGIFAGSGTNGYLLTNLASHRGLLSSLDHYQLALANEKDHMVTYASYKLNLRGPGVTVQTACSTSLVAVHLACQSLLNGECDLALAGGVSLNIPQRTGYLYQEGSVLSPDGHCRAFDARAQGMVGGDGVGLVVLKRRLEAEADTDTIYALIKGSAINNDGALKVGYTAPSVEGQREVIADALSVAEVSAETISYVEAHGTATPLGDPIEIAALTQAFRQHTEARTFCAIGSVKTNIGHLDAAAGVAGLIKTALALYHREIPPSLHFEQPNPQIDFAQSPFYVNRALKPWPQGQGPRRAGVSSFGMGGTNAHVILEEAPAPVRVSPGRSWQLIVLSAKTSTALEEVSRRLAAYLREHPQVELADIAYTLQIGRQGFAHRQTVLCSGREDALLALEAAHSKHRERGCVGSSPPPVIFLFSGQGSQYVRMAQGLYEGEAVFRKQIDRCAELLRPSLGLDIRQVLYPSEANAYESERQLAQTALTQPALFALEYALAQQWMSWGVHPQAMIGHSIGEYVAACLAGVFSLPDALTLVALRGRLMQQAPPGAMLTVPLSEHEVEPFLEDNLSLAAVNAPSLCVISGSFQAIDALQHRFAEEGLECRRLHTSHAFHSGMMESILEQFKQHVAGIPLHAPTIPYISNLTGTWITREAAVDPAYWSQHLRHPVRFSAGVQVLLQEPGRLFLEIGPGHTLNTLVKRHVPQNDRVITIASTRHPQEEQDDMAYLQAALGKAWLAGLPIDWKQLYTYEKRRRCALPTYPFERQRHWIEAAKTDGATASFPTQGADLSQKITELSNSHQEEETEATLAETGNDLERRLIGIWRELFGIDRIGLHDDFLELGGHSLLATQLIARVRDAFQVDLPARIIFNATTVAELAAVIEQAYLTQVDQDNLAQLLAEIQSLSSDELQQQLSGNKRLSEGDE